MNKKSKYLDFVLCNLDIKDGIQKYFIENGTFDEEVTCWMINNIKPGWIIYDIGANIFEYTEIAARLAKKDGKVYSFEPITSLVNNYLNNKSINNYDNVANIYIYNFALGDKNEKVTMYKSINNIGCSTLNKDFVKYSEEVYNRKYEIVESIDVKRADSINLLEESVDLLKLDIEGGEYSFWKGCPIFLKNSKNILIEIGPYTDIKLINELSKNRTCYDLFNNEINIYRIFKKNKFQKNVIFKKNNN